MLHLVLLLLALAPPAYQKRWKPIGTTSTGNPVFVDPRTVTTKNGITTATIRTVYAKPVDTPKGPITSVRSIAMFKCATHEVAAKATTLFIDEASGKIFEKRVPGIPGFAKSFPNTYADVAMTYLCAPK